MEDDQQFCLRWNNHQSTLVAVFDTLLENGTLVDCTLAAEGKYLNAHKVVLSACSPYFESLLSQNYDKHPIFILKDVKYQELKAMMDYMYRGEVNISQDQLGALLKAAESLQIKGLSDNRKGETETKKTVAPPPPAKSPPPTTSIPRVQGLTIEQRRRELEDSRESSQSPGARKRKRIRRRSIEDLENHHDASNSSESHHSSHAPAQNIPATLPVAAAPIKAAPATDVPEPVESKSEILTRHKPPSETEITQVPKEKLETHSELMLEPKAEYIEEMNEDSIEDLTLDDDDISNMEQMDESGAGPSHGNMGEGSGQGFGGWHMGNQSQDEVFLAAQEAVGAHRDSQDIKRSSLYHSTPIKHKDEQRRYQCDQCHRSYKYQSNLCNHKREECGKDPSYFCPVCKRGFKKKQHLQRHMAGIHGLTGPQMSVSQVPQKATSNSSVPNIGNSGEPEAKAGVGQSFAENLKLEDPRNTAATSTFQTMPHYQNSIPTSDVQSGSTNNMDYFLQQINDYEMNQQMKEIFLNKMNKGFM